MEQPVWGSRWVFFFAATAGAVGLGNIWQFPMVMAENGGIAFLLLYLLCIIVMGVPMMLSEVAVGHIGRANPVAAIKSTAVRSGASRHWSIIGYLGLFAGLSIFVMLTVVAGWVISYLLEIYQGTFIDIGRSNAQLVFEQTKTNVSNQLLYQSMFIFSVVFILGFGINKGLGRGITSLVPFSIVVLVFLLYHSLTYGNLYPAIEYLFNYDIKKLTFGAFVLAFEQAFYTLSIGVGSLMVLGAYLPKRGSIGLIVFSVALVDILISGAIGLVIVPILMSSQIAPVSGFDLLFVALPSAFGDMLNGQYLGVMFFIFVILTALSSALVLLEPCIAWCSERVTNGRWSAVILVGFVAWLISLACVQQGSDISGFKLQLFNLLDFATAKVILPLAGLLVAVYAGWILKPALVRDEIANTGMFWLYLWYFLIRFVAPSLFILILVLNQLDIDSILLFFLVQ
jgi:NSS family neurotransmitter:Na+ symporter